jgi:hypothetical protein
MEELVRSEDGAEGEGLFRGGAENRTGTVVQKHKTGSQKWGFAISAKKKWESNTFYTPA